MFLILPQAVVLRRLWRSTRVGSRRFVRWGKMGTLF